MMKMRRGLSAAATLLALVGCADGASDETALTSTNLAQEGAEEAAPEGAAATPAQAPAVDSAADAGLSIGPRGGAQSTPVDYNDPDLRCYPLVAYQSVAKRTDKYAVPTTPDYYVTFSIKAPWTGKQYIRAFRSIIDNKAVLHHWLLYRQTKTTGQSEGVLTNTSGAHPDGELLYGWAPGGDDLYFHQDVAMPVEEGTYFQLETHYNNTRGAAAPDASGVEVCVTPHAPEHLAAQSWLGTDRINGVSASGTCIPEAKEPIHVILATPHMHKTGTHMKVDWTHADGTVETIHDQAFDFDYQRSYAYDNLIVKPGDKLTTTCTYDKPAHFGKGTNDEMCYFFTMHWPAGSLAQTNFFTSLHGANTCINL